MLKIASVSSWFLGLGFGLPCIYGIWNLMKGNGIAYVMGFPTYGHGPFEKIGVSTSGPLMVGFLLVCILECVTGWSLWTNDKGGAVLSFAIIPIELLFYIGFALPFGPPLVIIRSACLLIGWSSLHRYT